MEEYPVSLFVCDPLSVDGQDLTQKTYPFRHKMLEKIIERSDRVRPAEYLITDNANELEKFFEKAVENGCEGVVCKSINEDSVYQAGARGWLWLKYKRDYKSEMTDTVYLVIVGAFHGRGKRGGTYCAILRDAYKPEERKAIAHTIRFPRFTGNYRLDKAAEDTTTVKEIIEMYQSQLKKVAE